MRTTKCPAPLIRWSLAILLTAWMSSCASCGAPPPPPEFCLSIEASSTLNLFDDQPHVVVVRFYPLQSVVAFRSTDPMDLLGGAAVAGATGDSWEMTILPGEVKEIRETLPRDTQYVGLLADFYRGPSRVAIECDCPTFGSPSVVLSSSDVQVQ